MTVIDLHPEDLLDKDARGELTEDEGAWLATHLARCTACRAERMLRADFAEELGADERPSGLVGLVHEALSAGGANLGASSNPATLAAPKAPATVMDGVMDTAAGMRGTRADVDPTTKPREDRATSGARERDVAAALRGRPRGRAFVVCVAAALFAASAAGATGLTGRVWRELRGTQEMTHLELSARSARAPTTASGRASGPEVVPRGPAYEDPLLVPTAVSPLASAPMPTAVSPLAPAPMPTLSLPIAPVSRLSSRMFAFAPATSRTSAARSVLDDAPAPATASALFDGATVARRRGELRTALSLYDALERQYPATREARLARATAARLLLDTGDASGALSRFEAYLASGAAELREEAMAGRATSLERLGRGEDETRAWATLLATYPRTPYASHARTRIGRPPNP